jgi:hypothetical protein
VFSAPSKDPSELQVVAGLRGACGDSQGQSPRALQVLGLWDILSSLRTTSRDCSDDKLFPTEKG